MLVYVASAYSDGIITENIKKAREYSRREVEKGNIPITPHLYFPQFLDEKTERDKAMGMNKELFGLCEELHVYGRITAGIKQEIEWAKELGISIKYYERG